LTAQPAAEQDKLWNQRWLLLTSCAMVVVAVVIVISTQATHWTWALLVWGVLVGVASAAVIEVVAHQTFATRSHDDAATTKWRRRRIIYVGLWLFFPTVFGLLAAAFDLVWIDVAFTAYVLLSLLAGGLAFRVIRRRQAT
jgi:bacteriorhodopsin